MHLIDSHAHLYSDQFDNDRAEMVLRAKAAGVTKIYLPNIDLSSTRAMLDLCLSDPEFFHPMMGLHPTSVKADYQAVLQQLFGGFDPSAYAAVGEIGIDLYWDRAFIKEQTDAFERQVVMAKQHHLPVVIHVRDSFTEVFEVIDRQMDDNLRGIFHCFTGTIAQAKKIMAYRSFKMGIGGVITFKNSGLDTFLKEVPLEYIVLETDAPYLAPVPHRGKRNESSFLGMIAEKVAAIYGMPVDRVAEVTSSNCSAIFGP